MNPTVKIESIQVEKDAGALRRLAEDVLAKRLTIPIDRMVPLAEAGDAQAVAEKGGRGKILLLA
jgi:NADPH:quinone reductase-like Zn-dependent oxidoreductase